MFILKTPRWTADNRHYEYRISSAQDISAVHDQNLAVSDNAQLENFGDSSVFFTEREAREAAGPDAELHFNGLVFP